MRDPSNILTFFLEIIQTSSSSGLYQAHRPYKHKAHSTSTHENVSIVWKT